MNKPIDKHLLAIQRLRLAFKGKVRKGALNRDIMIADAFFARLLMLRTLIVTVLELLSH